MPSENEQDTVETRLDGDGRPEGHTARVPSAEVHVDVGALSHRGNVRSNNEDHYLVGRFGRSLEFLLTNLTHEQLPSATIEVGYGMVVADGMGGAAAGEVASRCAIQDLVQLVLSTPDWILSAQSPWVEEIMHRMAERFRDIDRFISGRAARDPNLAGMGTTMTMISSLGLEAILCHIGDSRVYLFGQDRLTQLTRDMTMAQDMIDAGALSPTQAVTYRLRHILTQCLGGEGTARPEVRHMALAPGDRLLLCSDGLYDMIGNDQIADVLRAGAEPQAGCQELVKRALDAGGKDNVTVVLARYRV